MTLSAITEGVTRPPGFSGDVVVVTGAARGIGLGIAMRFSALGACVAMVDRDPLALGDASAKVSGSRAYVADLSKPFDVTNAIASVEREFGKVDVLVNNAGIVRDRGLLKTTEDDWDTVLSVNLKSMFLCAQAVLPGMVERGQGRIVNMSSRAWLGNAGQAAYSAAKGGVVSLTRSLALEFARHGITVNAIAPGIIDTPLFRHFAPELQDKLSQSVPARRIGAVDDIANAVEFFARRDSSYVTGQLLYVCGGRSLSGPSV